MVAAEAKYHTSTSVLPIQFDTVGTETKPLTLTTGPLFLNRYFNAH